MFITLRLLQFNPVRSVLSRPLDDTLHTLTVLYIGRKELVELSWRVDISPMHTVIASQCASGSVTANCYP